MQYEMISETHSHRIIALSETEIGKLPPLHRLVFVNVATGKETPELNHKMDIDLEIKRLEYANSINDLMVRFIRKDKFENDTDMMVMERLYPIRFHSIRKKKRISVFEKFEAQLSELHSNGFIHGDIQHPVRGEPEFLFNNIILTNNGLRLIDTGFSIIKKDEPNKEKYYHLMFQELREISNFKEYFLM